MTKTMPETNYPMITVIVFKGSPTATALTEYQRVTFEATEDGWAAACRCARGHVTRSRMNWETGVAHVPPVATIVEHSNYRGIGRVLREYTSRARAKFLARISAESVSK